MNILVTGCAGFIGSFVSDVLVKEGHFVVGIDNLSQGHREAVNSNVLFFKGDINNKASLESVFQHNKFDVVCHLAAETVVEYSMTDPSRYFKTNVVGGLNLLDTMIKYDVKRIIFSSSASVYGKNQLAPYCETDDKIPCNSYGESKLMFEDILKWYYRAYGLKYIAFRYFNAVGASDGLGEDHRPETHLIPNILKSALKGQPLNIYGTNYSTSDGSCIRDYVHVKDITKAHIMVLGFIDKLEFQAFNLGSVKASVLEVIDCCQKVTQLPITIVDKGVRKGDPAILVSDSRLAKELLGWKPDYVTLESMVSGSWDWFKNHLEGYTSG
jgi:UDP-glucose 4-epimerase